MFRSKREKAFFAETQKFFPATAIYNAFRHNLINPSKILPEQKKNRSSGRARSANLQWSEDTAIYRGIQEFTPVAKYLPVFKILTLRIILTASV